MSIFLNEHSKVIVQGITGGEGTKHSTKMLAAGTTIVGGVNARKAGSSVSIGGKDLTVFGTVEEAMKETGADVSVVFVPPKFAKDAVIEAIDSGIGLAVVITEGIPVHDSAYFWAHACAKGTPPGSSARTARGSSAPAGPTPASSRPTSPAPAGSAWCPSRAR
jgi:succinyl-CoA synthetase alpha subunit